MWRLAPSQNGKRKQQLADISFTQHNGFTWKNKQKRGGIGGGLVFQSRVSALHA